MNNTVLTELLNTNRGPTIGDIVMYVDNLPGVLTNKVYSNITILNSATQWKSLYPPVPIESTEQFEEEEEEEES